jgi:allantoinase
VTDLDLLLRAGRVVLPDGVRPAAVGVREGRITTVTSLDTPLPAARVVDLGEDEVLLPGLVDSHVHVNEPGRSEWEGFATATRAAAAGGVTTIVDMPLNSVPPTVDLRALRLKREIAGAKSRVDVAFWGGAVPESLGRLRELWEHGVSGFKCFLVDSGSPEFPALDLGQLEAAMHEIAAFDGLLIVHAEDSAVIEHHAASAGGPRYADFLSSRPRGAENLAVAHVIELARRTGCRIHLLHIASPDVLPMIESARHDGVRVSAETCPHYLAFAAEEIGDGATTYKCCPPIREGSAREALWRGLEVGALDLVVTDHSPSPPDLKCLDTGDFARAWGGISSLQLGLPVVWTEARRRGLGLDDVARWMSQAPARLAGLPAKGAIEVGRDADLCVLAPDEEFVVDPLRLHHRHPITPYAEQRLYGVVRSTWLRGAELDVDADPRGRLLQRGTS